MRQIAIAFYGEGPTDRYFLPPIIRRTAEDIVARKASYFVEVLEVDVIDNIAKQRKGKDILEAAIQYSYYDMLVVHKDADRRSYDETFTYCFEPGYLLVQAMQKGVCNVLVPIIPIREVEAWMLADPVTLKEVFTIKKRLQSPGLPKPAKSVEEDPDPKATFNKVIAQAASPPKSDEMSSYYEELAEKIKLERLQEVLAYRKFMEQLTAAFIKLNCIHSHLK